MKSRPSGLGAEPAFRPQCEFESRISRRFEFMQVAKARCRLQANFHRSGHQYFLAQVWNRDSFSGSQIRINLRQTELAKSQSKDEVVLIASRSNASHNSNSSPGGSP